MNSYAKSGVDVNRGYEVVKQIKEDVVKTHDVNVINNFGSFGGLYDLSNVDVKNPVLVSGTDGVGSKLNIAIKANDYKTIGQDLVAMCVNDIITIGAKPLFFLDYIAVNQIDVAQVTSIINSISNALVSCNTSLVGGETAEMGSLYKKGDFDLAGYVCGVVDKEKMIDITNVANGDVIIGLSSNGIHSNGYSLVNKTFFKDHDYDLNQYIECLDKTLKEELLTPTKIYVNEILSLIKIYNLKSITHITGGGFVENIPRGLPSNMVAYIDKDSYDIPPIFDLIQKLNNIDSIEMHEIFNMGIGMCVIVDKKDALDVIKSLDEMNQKAFIIGEVKEKTDEDMCVCFR